MNGTQFVMVNVGVLATMQFCIFGEWNKTKQDKKRILSAKRNKREKCNDDDAFIV